MNQYLHASHYTIWELIKLYWKSDQRKHAYIFFAVAMGMTVLLVAFEVVFNYWYNYFYDALQNYNQQLAMKLLVAFVGIAAVYIFLAVYRFYIAQLFGLRWRKWLTQEFLSRWLENKSYYNLETFDEKTDNPEQRIQEDIASVVSYSIQLSIGLVGAVATFFAFVSILWSLSGPLVLSLGSWGVLRLPGYLVWVSLLYAFVGSYFTIKLGSPLVPLNFEQQRREATFRFAATDLRAHAEHVALYDGEQHQKGTLNRLFQLVIDNWYLILIRQKKLLWFTSAYGQTAVILPLLVALPNYFDRVFMLGGLMQTMRAFGSVQDSVSFLVNSYTQIAEWQAVGQRLTTFVNHMNGVDEKAASINQVKRVEQPENAIIASHMNLSLPDGKVLMENINETFIHGRHYLLQGDSGLGKSTFVKALAGIWPYANGEVTLPSKQHIMYLSQKAYMPIGSLAEAILFPDEDNKALRPAIKEVLSKCHLDHLIPKLDDVATWSEKLSPGEQQRVAFARVLLHKPDWVFMDESTSMLDIANEDYLYRMLKRELPNCSIVSIGHRPSLNVHHDEVVDLTVFKAGASVEV